VLRLRLRPNDAALAANTFLKLQVISIKDIEKNKENFFASNDCIFEFLHGINKKNVNLEFGQGGSFRNKEIKSREYIL
jgi:hypothetical protein